MDNTRMKQSFHKRDVFERCTALQNSNIASSVKHAPAFSHISHFLQNNSSRPHTHKQFDARTLSVMPHGFADYLNRSSPMPDDEADDKSR